MSILEKRLDILWGGITLLPYRKIEEQMMKKSDWEKGTIILTLFLLIIIYSSPQIHAMGSMIQNISEDTCNEDCCDSQGKPCPVCTNSNSYLLRRLGTHLPQFTVFSFFADLDKFSDQGVIKIIPHPPPAIV